MKTNHEQRSDLGILILRFGVGVNFVLLFALKQAGAGSVFVQRTWPLAALALGAGLVTLGFRTRVVAGCMALVWGWILGYGIYCRQPFYLFPVRSALFVIVFGGLAFTGAGRFSLDHLLQSRR